MPRGKDGTDTDSHDFPEDDVTERPILFSGAMVRAILEERKTQTRRIVKDLIGDDETPTIECGLYHPTIIDRHGEEQPGPEIFGCYTTDGSWGTKCPYGQPGDLLWVRETWRIPGDSSAERVSDSTCTGPEDIDFAADSSDLRRDMFAWRPSIFMPRWASRITLEIMDVRAQKLQDISEGDAKAEGVERYGKNNYLAYDAKGETAPNAISSFASLWDSINGRKAAWSTNPWVWAVSFKVMI